MRHLVLGTALAAMAATGATAQEVTLGRFFGACEDAGTDTTTSVGEPCIIQSIINAADAELDGITVTTLPTDWGNYYDQIVAAYAAGDPPDVHVMHRHRIPQFAGLGALADLSGDLEAAGIDISDWAPTALEAVSYEGGIYGVPMDFHANLWHVNLDLLAQAGLVTDEGTPILPTLARGIAGPIARLVEEATGQDYLAARFRAVSPSALRLVLSLMWQQGANIFTEDRHRPPSTPRPRATRSPANFTPALRCGPRRPAAQTNADSQQAFLNGRGPRLSGQTAHGSSEFLRPPRPRTPDVALFRTTTPAIIPTLFAEGPATWADSHMWAIPASLRPTRRPTPPRLQVLAFINEHNIRLGPGPGTWRCATRCCPPRTMPPCRMRDEYTPAPRPSPATTPASAQYGAIQDVLNRELQAIWLTGQERGCRAQPMA